MQTNVESVEQAPRHSEDCIFDKEFESEEQLVAAMNEYVSRINAAGKKLECESCNRQRLMQTH